MKQLILFLGFSYFLCSSCSDNTNQSFESVINEESSSDPTIDDHVTTDGSEEDFNNKDDDPFDYSWRNPALLPIGTSIGKLIRAYYLIGDFASMTRFLVIPPEIEKTEVIKSLQHINWGYEIRLKNLQWNEDSSFILTYETNINNTIGIEQMKGTIISDTARIMFFPNQGNPLVFIE